MRYIFFILLLISVCSCGESLLHDDYVFLEVPETVSGAKPIYADGVLPAPNWTLVPDTLEPGIWNIGDY